MTLRRAFWMNDAEVRLAEATYAVGYEHQIASISTNPGEVTHFYQYQARDESDDRDGTASDWGETFKWQVARTGKLVVPRPGFDTGLVFDARCVDCSGGSLLIEVNRTTHELIRIETDPERLLRGWVPKGYADFKHFRNHPDIRSR